MKSVPFQNKRKSYGEEIVQLFKLQREPSLIFAFLSFVIQWLFYIVGDFLSRELVDGRIHELHENLLLIGISFEDWIADMYSYSVSFVCSLKIFSFPALSCLSSYVYIMPIFPFWPITGMFKSSYCFIDLKKFCCSFRSVHGMMLKRRLGMRRRNALEAVQLECLQMLKITHLKEAEVADNGDRGSEATLSDRYSWKVCLEPGCS